MKFGKSSNRCKSCPTKAEPSRLVASLATVEVTKPAMRRYASVWAAASQPRNIRFRGVQVFPHIEGSSKADAMGESGCPRRGTWPWHVRRGRPSNLGYPSFSMRNIRKIGEPVTHPRTQHELAEAQMLRPSRKTSQRKKSIRRKVGQRQGEPKSRPTGTRESEDPIGAMKPGNGWHRSRSSKVGPCRE